MLLNHPSMEKEYIYTNIFHYSNVRYSGRRQAVLSHIMNTHETTNEKLQSDTITHNNSKLGTPSRNKSAVTLLMTHGKQLIS